PKRHKEGHSKSVVSQAENAQLDVIQQKLDALQQTVTLMLEDKMAREAENRLRNEEREQLQAEISRLADALAQEKKRGFWSRLFRSGSE
ncbi:entry exclusion protein 1, partial [Escherichia coli]